MQAGKVLKSLASLKLAIPLLVITVVVTIVGSLFPDPDIFRAWWYIGLLGMLGLSLLLITILHIPSLARRKGRNALIGVVAVHTGILVLIAGAMYGGISGFRHNVKAIEGEMTIVPGLPFVVHLDELVIEEYPEKTFAHLNLDLIPKKTQDSRISLHRRGASWKQIVAAPGRPAHIDGITILPSVADIGWYFELIVTSPGGIEQTIPVKPWAPPLIRIGELQIMAHRLGDQAGQQAQVFTMENEQMKVLGEVGLNQPLELDGYFVNLGTFKRYTGLSIYSRPQTPVLALGVLLMMVGLIWHFYHRYKD